MEKNKKLVIATNQSDTFVSFHKAIQSEQPLYDYMGYSSLLFECRAGVARAVNVTTGRSLDSYEAAYVTGYKLQLELAHAVALVLDKAGIPFADRELHTVPSLTKLTEYIALGAANITIPHSYGGTAGALVTALKQGAIELAAPLVVKRATADRGIDNFLCYSKKEAREVLAKQSASALWIVQEFVPNDGFYRIGVYNDKVAFGIFRALGERSDHRRDKAHIFKPHGGSNATLIEAADLPSALHDQALRASQVLGREFAGVDCLYDKNTGQTIILEVNYNPQLVTIETFQQTRIQAFLTGIKELGNEE